MAYKYEEMSWSDVRDLFRKWREENERKSSDVIQLWEAVLEYNFNKLGNERHLVLEQVIIAALDTNRINIAGRCIRKLSAEFPGSMRVQKYKAMLLESVGRYSKAIEVFDAIITKDETNPAPRKRKIAILKAKGKIPEAIKELCEYLKTFMSDQEAWHELCNLYLMGGEYAKAAFCMEEVLLHNPHSHLIHQRLAEIRYTMGGNENIEIAKSYYSQAVKLNPTNLRALYGLYLCCNQIVNSKVNVSKKKEAQKLGSWALSQAMAQTTKASKIEKNDKYISALESALGNMEIKSN